MSGQEKYFTRHGSGTVHGPGLPEDQHPVPDPRPTWTDLGHPELEGQPFTYTVSGPVPVPEFPPLPGPRHGTGA
jgi:hypothetical protein